MVNSQNKSKTTAAIGPIMMISAGLLYTTMNIIIKLLGPVFKVWDITFFRFFGGMILLMIILGRRKNSLQGHNTRLLIIRGCIGSITFFLLVATIRLLPVSTAMILFYSFPAFAAIFSFLILKERITITDCTCIAAVMLGVIILFDFKLEGQIIGYILGILAGMLAGIDTILIRALREKDGPASIALYNCVIGALCIFPVYITNPTIPGVYTEWILCAGIVLFALAAQLLMIQGFGYCKSWEGGVFMTSEVIFTALIGIIFLQDPATLQFFIGGLFIIGSAITLNAVNSKSVEKNRK